MAMTEKIKLTLHRWWHGDRSKEPVVDGWCGALKIDYVPVVRRHGIASLPKATWRCLMANTGRVLWAAAQAAAAVAAITQTGSWWWQQ